MNTSEEPLIRLPRPGSLSQEVASFLVCGVVGSDPVTLLRVKNGEAAEEQLERGGEGVRFHDF